MEDQIKRPNRVNTEPGAGAPPGLQPYAAHDGAIRNHLSSLVRAMLQDGKKAELAEALQIHRAFIDEILGVLTQDPGRK